MFSFSTIERYRQDLDNGRTSCTAAVRHFLSRIEANAALNAFAEVFADEALARAAELDAAPREGALHGVVVGLKDNLCYKGHRVSAASAILQDFVSLYSATAVERLLAEGAIVIGRQNCDEFGMGSTNENSVYGPVPNPADPTRVAGGSSGGSAAAVKAGLCMASLGSDTGGSVRLPAGFCGVVGLKPAYGRVSRHGLIAYASSFDVIGVLAANVEDAFRVLKAVAGPDAYDSTAATEPPVEGVQKKTYRIAYFPDWLHHPSVDPEISAAIAQLIQRLKNEGHSVEPVDFPLTEYIVPTYYILTTAEASSNLARYDGVRFGKAAAAPLQDLAEFYRQNRSCGFGAEVKRRILLGSFVLSTGYYEAYFTKAQQVRRLLQQKTELIFNEYDFILSPTAPGIAYKSGQNKEDKIALYMGDIFTVFASLTGLAAINLPLFKHSSNLPFGIQLHASPQNEVSLQRFAHQLMPQ